MEKKRHKPILQGGPLQRGRIKIRLGDHDPRSWPLEAALKVCSNESWRLHPFTKK
jgi:hypothetical protein